MGRNFRKIENEPLTEWRPGNPTREFCEEKVEYAVSLYQKSKTSFYELGNALLEVRAGALYRFTHDRWEQFCKDRLDSSKRQVDRLIESAEWINSAKQVLAAPCEASEDLGQNVPVSTQVNTDEIPAIVATRGHIKELSKSHFSKVKKVIETLSERFKGKQPTAKEVAAVVKEVGHESKAKPPGKGRERIQALWDGEEIKQFDKLRRVVTGLATDLTELSMSDVGQHLGHRLHSLKNQLKEIGEIIKHAEPYCECVMCEGVGCATCYESGHITKMMFDSSQPSKKHEARLKR